MPVIEIIWAIWVLLSFGVVGVHGFTGKFNFGILNDRPWKRWTLLFILSVATLNQLAKIVLLFDNPHSITQVVCSIP